MLEIKPKVTAIDPVWHRVCEEAVEAIRSEPLLGGLIHSGLLHHSSLERALAYFFAEARIGRNEQQILREIADQAYDEDPRIGAAARSDLMAVYERDPACHRFLQPILFFKGYQAVQAYRIGHWLWQSGRIDLAYFVQMRVSEIFGVDIHPAARVGKGIMIDHAHSIVIGETRWLETMFPSPFRHAWRDREEDGDRHPRSAMASDQDRGQGRAISMSATARVSRQAPSCLRTCPNSTVAGSGRVVGRVGCASPLTMDQILKAE
jgi:serine O-acetyltransferase